eukprot:TRINITY_DN56770_c0_g1_i1.p1 TRINITY_DN56770_c0_g1~~TRINITY_DN56770_c0_g1_i1.p1  ORF type:complete len:918 (-),score=67.94 TRINITY_DN56770_c0_g1_i1:121-2523(-)
MDALLMFMYYLFDTLEEQIGEDTTACVVVDMLDAPTPGVNFMRAQAKMMGLTVGRSFPLLFSDFFLVCTWSAWARKAVSAFAQAAGQPLCFVSAKELVNKWGAENIPSTVGGGGQYDLNAHRTNSPCGTTVFQYYSVPRMTASNVVATNVLSMGRMSVVKHRQSLSFDQQQPPSPAVANNSSAAPAGSRSSTPSSGGGAPTTGQATSSSLTPFGTAGPTNTPAAAAGPTPGFVFGTTTSSSQQSLTSLRGTTTTPATPPTTNPTSPRNQQSEPTTVASTSASAGATTVVSPQSAQPPKDAEREVGEEFSALITSALEKISKGTLPRMPMTSGLISSPLLLPFVLLLFSFLGYLQYQHADTTQLTVTAVLLLVMLLVVVKAKKVQKVMYADMMELRKQYNMAETILVGTVEAVHETQRLRQEQALQMQQQREQWKQQKRNQFDTASYSSGEGEEEEEEESIVETISMYSGSHSGRSAGSRFDNNSPRSAPTNGQLRRRKNRRGATGRAPSALSEGEMDERNHHRRSTAGSDPASARSSLRNPQSDTEVHSGKQRSVTPMSSNVSLDGWDDETTCDTAGGTGPAWAVGSREQVEAFTSALKLQQSMRPAKRQAVAPLREGYNSMNNIPVAGEEFGAQHSNSSPDVMQQLGAGQSGLQVQTVAGAKGKLCSVCSSEFNTLKRRAHTCRVCGNLICAKCSSVHLKVWKRKHDRCVCIRCAEAGRLAPKTIKALEEKKRRAGMKVQKNSGGALGSLGGASQQSFGYTPSTGNTSALTPQSGRPRSASSGAAYFPVPDMGTLPAFP